MISVNFGTPQLLVLLSLPMFQYHVGFSITMFSLGLIGAMLSFSIDYSREQEKAKQNADSADNLNKNLNTLIGLAGADLAKKNFH